MSHIFAATERDLGIVIDHGRQDTEYVKRLWHELSHPAQYHAHSDNAKGPAVSVIDNLRNDFENVLQKAEQDAAKVERYESEPLVAGLIGVLESVPTAKDVITPVLAGLSKLASMAPQQAPPAEPTAPAGAPDPQLQTGIAV